jgi:hypothetical protein
MQRRFILDGGEAYDAKTGLTWQRCSLGTRWDGEQGCVGDQEFASLDEAMGMVKELVKESGQGWRVPSGPELESIVDRSCGQPVVDQAVFPDIRPNDEGAAEFWTTNLGVAELFYYFDFMTGLADGHNRGFHLAVRLVKTGR